MAEVMDRIKEMGFKFATKSGTTIAMSDNEVPKSKPKLIAEAEDLGHLNRMVLGLRRVPGVHAVQRAQKL